ncbi:MAG: HDOD domain-containing protein [Magnetococcales bacterium]|nr:HDOD domain-containing protein [Magnetococcales bacterium]
MNDNHYQFRICDIYTEHVTMEQASPPWDPQQVLKALAASRQDLLKLADSLMAALESEKVHTSLAPIFARLYRRIVTIIEEEREFLEKMNHPEKGVREGGYKGLTRQVAEQYQAFKKAENADEQRKVAVAVMEAINGFVVKNSLLWDQLTRDAKGSQVDAEAVEMEQAEGVLARIGIPSPPRILMEISKEMKRDQPDIGKLSGLVKEDPGLSAKVIQVVNSPLYGLRVQVSSINHAVSLLGLKLFQRAVLASTLRNALNAGMDNRKFETFWQHSVIVARAAEFIAVWLKDYEVSADLAYMAGLFHDCAIPPLMAKFPNYGDLFTDGAVSVGQNIREMENNGFNTNHCVVGSLISKSWGLDPVILDVIRYHHHDLLPDALTQNEMVRKLWHVLKITEIITSHLVWKAGGRVIELPRAVAENPVDHVGERVLREVGLNRSEFSYLIEDVEELASLGDIA